MTVCDSRIRGPEESGGNADQSRLALVAHRKGCFLRGSANWPAAPGVPIVKLGRHYSPYPSTPTGLRASSKMSLPLSFYKTAMAGSFAARGVESPSAATYAPTYTQQVTAQFMAPAKKEFSAQAFVTDLAIVRAPARTISRTATASIRVS